MTSRERRARLGVCAAMAALVAAWLGPALGGGRLLWFRDLIQNLYPWRKLWAEEARSGRWPLWDPYSASGAPFLANPNNLSLHPFGWLQAVLPFDLAFNWMLALTWALGPAGLYRLGRALGLRRGAALAAALAYGGSGFLVSSLNLANMLLAAAALPWAAWGAVRVGIRGSARDVAVLAAALALCALGGEPVALALAGAASLAFAVGTRESGSGAAAAGASRRGASRRLRGWLAACALGFLLAAPLLVPAADFLRRSERGAGLAEEERGRWPLTLLGALEMLVPGLGGDPTSFDPARFWSGGRHPGGMPLLVSLYLGAPIMVLAAAGWAGLPRRARGAAAVWGVACLALAAGPHLPFYALLELAGPVARWVRYPSKFLCGFFPLACLMAGFGLERLERSRSKVALGFAAALSGAGAVALALDRADPLFLQGALGSIFTLAPAAAAAAGETARGALSQMLVAAVAGASLCGPLRRRLPAKTVPALWVALIAGDHWLAQRHLAPSLPALALRLRPAFAEHLGEGARLFRQERPPGFRLRAPDSSRLWGFLWDRATFARATASEARVHTILERPTDRMWPESTARLRRWMLEADPPARASLLRRLGAEWWLDYDGAPVAGTDIVDRNATGSDPPLVLRRVRGALEPVGWRGCFSAAGSDDDLRRGLLSGSGPDLWLEIDSPVVAECGGSAGAGGRCRVLDRTTDHLDLRCDSRTAGVAYVLDAWDPGWEVRVNGARMDLQRVNGAYRGVLLPPGRHAVQWRYRPLSVQAGRALGFLGLALLAAAAGGTILNRGHE